ncbi:MAG: UvrD-helicase domain-containing protein, partial [Anaerolineae bacterium]|nr:UvrD-helicase domain-containing protein [Anaerolineae bacterium]
MHLIKKQQEIANANFATTIFVEGAAGTGKTTAAIERVKSLIK